MDFSMVKMFLGVLCLAVVAHLIQGASQCVRTNSDPSRHCTDECTLLNGCRNSRKKCLCDGDCGYSCVHPRVRCSKPRNVRNGQVIFKSYRFNSTQRVVCKSGFRKSGSSVRTCRGNGYWDGKQARCKRPQKNCKDPGTKGLLLRTTGNRKSFKPGTKLIYYCPDKFTLSGASIMVCRRDGTWSASLPQCIVRKCHQAVLPAHTQVRSPKNWKRRKNYGERLSLTCDYGYTSTQRGTMVCDPPGWRIEPTSFKCFPKSCPDPGRLRNGNVKGLFSFGEKVYYTCDHCYKLKGPSYRQCQADQQWTDNQPTCEPVSCSRLQNPTNGYLTFNSQDCDNIVQYHCDHGYQLNGSPRRQCQSDGTWTGNDPVCETMRCQDPGTPRNGNKNGKLQVGQTLHFSCAPCFKLGGDSTRTCQADLTWTGRQPICTVVRCSTLRHPTNGRMRDRPSRYCGGKPTEFICYAGYRLTGSRKISCQSDGRWSAASPTCVAVKTRKLIAVTSSPTTTHVRTTSISLNSTCGNPGLSPEARIMRLKNNVLLIGCKVNYVAVNTGLMWCRGNKWTSVRKLSCLARTCSDPGVPKNGNKRGVSYLVGDVVRFTCDDCYRLVGNSEIRCLKNESWSYTRPLCVLKTCPVLSNTRQAIVSYHSRACKDVATYTCNGTRLTMLGSGEKICNKSGMWEGAEPKCISPNLNIALGKHVSMSSNWSIYSGPASLVVDGNRKGRFIHTHYENKAWVKIDLLKEDAVSTVIVVNRRDCCVRRINGFKVSVGNNGEKAEKNAECGGRSKAKGGENIIQCRSTLRGRYVFVHMTRDTTMALFEVEVYRQRITE